jgi:hypothetical protein
MNSGINFIMDAANNSDSKFMDVTLKSQEDIIIWSPVWGIIYIHLVHQNAT